MKRFAGRSALSVGVAAGLALTASPALASPGGPGVEAVVVRQGTVSGSELIAQAAREGTPYSAAEAAAIKKAPCRWVERQAGYRKGKKGYWYFWVKERLNWCYDGAEVVSAKAKYRSYTRNKNVYRWRGWSKKKLVHTGSWSSVTARVKGKFYYTGDGRTYKPWATITGRYDGSASWWSASN
ncbi:hypothetical protein EDD29_3370 [Actinocorallia herbida]|uniref:Uncharacterized protein n=1 Tax=Actinocorallia herbida TaxID=58109 RepID=A0A3N1CX07_9ACTN|nr:hypothetical protein [Actinocorallia herbida]ROO85821.1 hypothetical protein EDD29_3370 [Actinocorallia herbida]